MKYMSPWTAVVLCCFLICALFGWMSWNWAVHPDPPKTCHETVALEIHTCMGYVSDEEVCLTLGEPLMKQCVEIDRLAAQPNPEME